MSFKFRFVWVFERKVKGNVTYKGNYDDEKDEGYYEVSTINVGVVEKVIKEICVVYCIT